MYIKTWKVNAVICFLPKRYHIKVKPWIRYIPYDILENGLKTDAESIQRKYFALPTSIGVKSSKSTMQ